MFFTKYTKSLLNLNVFKNNYIYLNIYLNTSLDASSFIGFEYFNSVFLVNKLRKYCCNVNYLFSAVLTHIKTPHLYLSTHLPLDQITTLNFKDNYLYAIYDKSLFCEINNNNFTKISIIHYLIFNIFFIYTLEFYKKLITLLINNVIK